MVPEECGDLFTDNQHGMDCKVTIKKVISV